MCEKSWGNATNVTFLMTWVEALHITYSLMLILLSVFLSKPLQGWKCSGGMLVSGMLGSSSSGAIFSGSSPVDSSCRLSSIVVPSLLSVKIQTHICYPTRASTKGRNLASVPVRRIFCVQMSIEGTQFEHFWISGDVPWNNTVVPGFSALSPSP